MKKKHCCANEARFLRLLPQQQGRNEIRWRPGQEASLAPPCSNLRSLGSKCTALKNVFVTLLGLYGVPHSDWALPLRFGDRGIVPPLTPLVTPLCNMGHVRYSVKRLKRFVNVHLRCIVSNMERISKISSFPTLEKFLRTLMLLIWILFKIMAFFRHVLVVSYLQIQQTKNLWIIEILINYLFAIFSLETWNLRDRDSRKWVSRLHHILFG